MNGCDIRIFFVRMRRSFLTLDTIDILSIIYAEHNYLNSVELFSLVIMKHIYINVYFMIGFDFHDSNCFQNE